MRSFAVTDAEIHAVTSLLRKHTVGLTRAELGRMSGLGERRARQIAEACRRRRIAPIVSVESNIVGKKVYKIGNEGEIRAYLTEQRSRLRSLTESIDGLEYMLEHGSNDRQAHLFGSR